jgi:hypothetical protein
MAELTRSLHPEVPRAVEPAQEAQVRQFALAEVLGVSWIQGAQPT